MLTLALYAVLVAIFLHEMVYGDWTGVFLVAQALAIGAIPFILRKTIRIYTPATLHAGILVFLFATIFLGEMKSFYKTFWWWDQVLHFVAAIGLTIIGFILFFMVFNQETIKRHALFVSVYSFLCAIGLAVTWEIYEFLVDFFFATEEKLQPSNADTMTDILISFFGALIATGFGYAYSRYRYDGFLAKVIEEADVKNNGHS